MNTERTYPVIATIFSRGGIETPTIPQSGKDFFVSLIDKVGTTPPRVRYNLEQNPNLIGFQDLQKMISADQEYLQGFAQTIKAMPPNPKAPIDADINLMSDLIMYLEEVSQVQVGLDALKATQDVVQDMIDGERVTKRKRMDLVGGYLERKINLCKSGSEQQENRNTKGIYGAVIVVFEDLLAKTQNYKPKPANK